MITREYVKYNKIYTNKKWNIEFQFFTKSRKIYGNKWWDIVAIGHRSHDTGRRRPGSCDRILIEWSNKRV